MASRIEGNDADFPGNVRVGTAPVQSDHSARLAEIQAVQQALSDLESQLVGGTVVDVNLEGNTLVIPDEENATSLRIIRALQRTEVTTSADVAGSLDETYFLFRANDPETNDDTIFGVVLYQDSVGTNPNAGAADEWIEVVFAENDTAEEIASLISAAINDHAEASDHFSAENLADIVVIDHTDRGRAADAEDGSSPTGFDFETTTEGGETEVQSVEGADEQKRYVLIGGDADHDLTLEPGALLNTASGTVVLPENHMVWMVGMSGGAVFILPAFQRHGSRHENDGDDEINVGGLSGELADPQTPKSHDNEAHDRDFITQDEGDARYVELAGDTMTGSLDMALNRIRNLPVPANPDEPLREEDATATPAASKIVRSGASGKIDAGWLPDIVLTSVVVSAQSSLADYIALDWTDGSIQPGDMVIINGATPKEFYILAENNGALESDYRATHPSQIDWDNVLNKPVKITQLAALTTAVEVTIGLDAAGNVVIRDASGQRTHLDVLTTQEVVDLLTDGTTDALFNSQVTDSPGLHGMDEAVAQLDDAGTLNVPSPGKGNVLLVRRQETPAGSNEISAFSGLSTGMLYWLLFDDGSSADPIRFNTYLLRDGGNPIPVRATSATTATPAFVGETNYSWGGDASGASATHDLVANGTDASVAGAGPPASTHEHAILKGGIITAVALKVETATTTDQAVVEVWVNGVQQQTANLSNSVVSEVLPFSVLISKGDRVTIRITTTGEAINGVIATALAQQG